MKGEVERVFHNPDQEEIVYEFTGKKKKPR